MIAEKPLEAGHFGSLVWARTERRIIIRHLPGIPDRPPPSKVRSLREYGFSNREIALELDVCVSSVRRMK